MSSLNKVMIIGNLGADPEIRSFANGGRIANLRVATTERWKKDGEKKERTEWHSVVISGDGLVGVVERYLRKGSKVYVEGQLQTRKWQDQSGQDRYSTEVRARELTMLDGAQGGNRDSGGSGWGGSQGGGNAGNQGGSSGGDWNTGTTGGTALPDLDDDIPFVTSSGMF